MIVLKKIIYYILTIIVLLLILAFFMSRDITASVSRESKIPANYLYNLANNMSAMKLWNPWVIEDTSLVLKYTDKNEGVGAGYSWDSKDGKGSVMTTKVVVNELIEVEMDMGDDDEKAHYQQRFKTEGGRTSMTWDFQAKMSWPFNVASPVMKYMMKKYFNKGMKNMEEICLNRVENSTYRSFKIDEVQQGEFHFITSRNEVNFSQMDEFYAQNLAIIYKKIQDAGLTAVGNPCGLYYKWDAANNRTDMAVGVPVTEAKEISELATASIPARSAYVIHYYGDRSKTENAHQAMDEYFKDHNLLSDVPVIEEYASDPLVEKDPNKWLTNIIYYATAKN